MKAFRLLAVLALTAGCEGSPPTPAALLPPPLSQAAAVIDGPSAGLIQKLPAGIPAPDSRHFYWLAGDRLHVTDTGSGAELTSLPVAAGSRLAGISPTGARLVLSDPGGAGARFTTFDTHHLGSRPAIANLAPNFEFDAISENGESLYLIERKEALGAGRYSVTVFFASRGGLCNCTVVDKTEPGTSLMRGTRVMSVPGREMVYTLYDGGGHDGAFVHALSLANPIAWCIDLPAAPGQTGAWQIGLTAGGNELIAVNLAAGVAARADVSRAANDKPPITAVAQFAPSPGPAPGRHGVLSAPDGHNLFVLGANSVVELDATSLQPKTNLLAALQPVAIAGSPDGQWQYALTASGQFARLNPLLSAPPTIATGLEAPMLVIR